MNYSAKAHSNIALIKYFGKIDEQLNLPEMPSISMTLESFYTQAKVIFAKEFNADSLLIQGIPTSGEPLDKVSLQLDRVACHLGKKRFYAQIETTTNFPIAAGLASSASSFAAITLSAVTNLLDYPGTSIPLSVEELSILARQGSASAARSIPGGIVSLSQGIAGEINSSVAHKIPIEWDNLRLVIGMPHVLRKTVSSSKGMKDTKKTSPFYATFVENMRKYNEQMLVALTNFDFAKVGELTEKSALEMHSAALSAMPSVIYWFGFTLEALRLCQKLRRQGIAAWFTCDAGPVPKILTLAQYEPLVVSALAKIDGIANVLVSSVGGKAIIIPR